MRLRAMMSALILFAPPAIQTGWRDVQFAGPVSFQDAATFEHPKHGPQPLANVLLVDFDVADAAVKRKDVFKDCDKCPEMVVIPAGSFDMGSPANEAGHAANEEPQHRVTILNAFAAGKFAVTVDQFSDFVNETGYDAGSKCWTFEERNWGEQSDRSFRKPGFSQNGSHPAVCLNWNDAKAYVDWLSQKTGKPYRLLTEAEWEYAARAGTSTRYFFGDNENDMCRFGNGADQTAKREIAGIDDWRFINCSDGYAFTAPVGSFLPNAFGLYDMHGNAFQWVEDCWNANYDDAPSNGSAWTSGDCSRRVLRGGSWSNGPRLLRAAIHYWSTTEGRDNLDGFRLGRTLKP